VQGIRSRASTKGDPALKLIGELFNGPIDIIGDVHGEIEALARLLDKLGYDASGRHKGDRRLVFLGDLTDRGPDSPAVLDLVAALVGAERAQCVTGNHELNLMRDVRKHGNEWWAAPQERGRLPAVSVTAPAKQRYDAFLHTLPLALERDDLRVVHACWSSGSIEKARGREAESIGVLEFYKEHAQDLQRRWESAELQDALDAELSGIDLKNRDVTPPLLPRLAQRDAENQMSNPVTVLTSGEEAPTSKPFWAGGRWRMVERVKWWEEYDDAVPVVVGHYWRRYNDAPTSWADKYGPDLFEDVEPHHWMGERRNVYCVDFSVGGRSEQRYAGDEESHCQLAALRVPDWQVVHDDGGDWAIGEPGRHGST
jgi:hypothetical protein